MKDKVLSKKPRQLANALGGVSISEYANPSQKAKRTQFKFKGIDAERIFHMVAPALSEDGNRCYFLMDEKGFTVRAENKSITSKKFDALCTKGYAKFHGEYEHLEWDAKYNAWYVCAENKNRKSNGVDEENGSDDVTLTREEYNKIMKIVEELI